MPPSDSLLRKLRTLLTVYREAGGTSPVLLLHDDEHGGALIDALARHGDGLPAHVLPLAVNEVTQIGLECVAAKVVGKQPPPEDFWIAAGSAPVFLKSEGPLYEDGPVWRIELASPVWPNP